MNDKKLLDSLNVGYDVITDVATVPGGPYLLVGCESGNCKVIHVQIKAGVEPVSPRDEGVAMESLLLLQPYQSRWLLFCYLGMLLCLIESENRFLDKLIYKYNR